MKLFTKAQEKALVDRVRAAHAKLVRGILEGDLPEVSLAMGALSGAERGQQKALPTVWRIRQLVKSGQVDVDSDAAEASRTRLADAAKAVRDRLVAAVRSALHDGNALLRRSSSGRGRAAVSFRKKAVDFVEERVEKALATAEREWQVNVDVAIHDAMEEGKAQHIVKSRPGVLVYKKIQPDCCRFCRLLYTTDGKTPRLFTVDELVSNGSNVGRRAGRPILKGEGATEWLPVLGVVHPGCRCSLVAVTSKKGASR